MCGGAYYAEIGKKGGDRVFALHGSAFFSEIGKRGGNEVKRRYGPDYYSVIGKMGDDRHAANDVRQRVSEDVGIAISDDKRGNAPNLQYTESGCSQVSTVVSLRVKRITWIRNIGLVSTP